MPRLTIRRLNLALALLVFCCAAALHQPTVTYACSCVPPAAPIAARDGATAVFAGTVSGIARSDPTSGGLLVTFDLSQTWKGPEGPQLTIATSDNSASCGFEFTQGEEYIVYAFAQDGQIQTNLCSRTAPLAGAGEDLAALGPGTPVAAGAGAVGGVDAGMPWLPLAVGGVGAALLLVGVVALRRRGR